MHTVLFWALLNAIWPVKAQTYTTCNPLKEICPPNPALGRSIHIDFSEGPSSSMIRSGSATITYDSKDGAMFSVAGPGHNPTLTSKFYFMFGRVTVVCKAAEGAGVVSSVVLQSDDLDEIDIEFVGNDPGQFQTNYFGKGDTSTYDRGTYHKVSDGPITESFHKFTIEWTPSTIKWYLGDQLVRTLSNASNPSRYPQTPMSLRLGAWAAGDKSNPQGTVEWAGGPIDYSKGPFTYSVQEVDIEDYSTGTSYRYTNKSGDWQSIEAIDGQVGKGRKSPKLFQNLVRSKQPI